MKKPQLTFDPRFKQGLFVPKNPEKYVGDVSKIIYRSGLERRWLKFFDEHPSILAYGSEEITIPYISPLDKKPHRYFPDFIIKVKDAKGEVNTLMIEIKPHKEKEKPVKGNKKQAVFIKEAMTYVQNQAKWQYASEFCERNGMSFVVWTEKELKWL